MLLLSLLLLWLEMRPLSCLVAMTKLPCTGGCRIRQVFTFDWVAMRASTGSVKLHTPEGFSAQMLP